MRITLAKVKASTIPQSIGIAACDPRFLRYLNEAQERLAMDGKWWGTYKKLRVCVTAGCVTWPEDVLTVEAMTVCGTGIPIRNGWFEFQEDVRAPKAPDCSESCEQRQLLDRGLVYQYRDFTALSTVRIYPASATDVGKRVLLQGLDANGNVIRTNDPTEGWVDGEYVTLASPFVESVNAFAAPGLTGVQKPLTNNRLTVTGVAVVGGTETQVAIWAPSVTSPEYRRTYLIGWPRCAQSPNTCADQGDGCTPADTSCSNTVVEAIVRLRFIEAIVDTDWMFISNMRALKSAMRSMQMEDANDQRQAEIHYQQALRALRNELEARSPKERMVVNVLPFGVAEPVRIFGGFI